MKEGDTNVAHGECFIIIFLTVGHIEWKSQDMELIIHRTASFFEIYFVVLFCW